MPTEYYTVPFKNTYHLPKVVNEGEMLGFSVDPEKMAKIQKALGIAPPAPSDTIALMNLGNSQYYSDAKVDLQQLVTQIDRIESNNNVVFHSKDGEHPLTDIEIDYLIRHPDSEYIFDDNVSQRHKYEILQKSIEDNLRDMKNQEEK